MKASQELKVLMELVKHTYNPETKEFDADIIFERINSVRGEMRIRDCDLLDVSEKFDPEEKDKFLEACIQARMYGYELNKEVDHYDLRTPGSTQRVGVFIFDISHGRGPLGGWIEYSGIQPK